MEQKKEIKSYRDLLVWQQGMNLAKECYILTKRFPKEELYGLTSQIRRASSSIPANISFSRESGVGNREWEIGSRKWMIKALEIFNRVSLYSLFSTAYCLLPTPFLEEGYGRRSTAGYLRFPHKKKTPRPNSGAGRVSKGPVLLSSLFG